MKGKKTYSLLLYKYRTAVTNTITRPLKKVRI